MSQINSHDVGDDHILVDVRSPAEFEAERIPNSRNIPLDEFASQADSLSNHDKIVLVCASGNRAKRARKVLEDKNIESEILEDGIKGWKRAEKTLLQSDSGTISLERQVRILAGSLVALGAFLALFVHPYWAALSAFIGCGLVFAGVTDTCGMALVLAKLPYNKKCSGGNTCS